VAGAAAVVAWTLVSTLDAGSPRHEPTRTSSTARPVAVAPAKSDSPPVALAARSDGNSGGSNGDEVGQESREVSREESRQVSPQESREEPQESHQEPRREAILGVPAALAASTVAAEAVPAIALDPPKAERAPPSLIIRQMDRDELAFLVRRGEIFINSGDVAAARLMLQRAAEAGDVHAALALASTFDPNTIQELGIQGLAADEAMARLWYERAAQFGSPEAPQRLQQLANQANQLP
jgi:TPR repeat protein